MTLESVKKPTRAVTKTPPHRTRAQRRIAVEVPRAAVVVSNSTYFAVAELRADVYRQRAATSR